MDSTKNSEDGVDQMFDNVLEQILEEKRQRALEDEKAGIVRKPEPLPTPEELEKELLNHPFFLKKMPEEGEPLPPLLEAFQQLKYSDTDNTREDLLENYKKDGLFHFKLKKWRAAALGFTEAMKYADDPVEKAKLYNNRAACQYHIENYGSSLRDCEAALKLDEKYVKAFIRALHCCANLHKWDYLINLHQQYNFKVEADRDQKQEIEKLYLQAVRNSKHEAKEKRKSEHVRKLQEEADANLLKVIKERGIKLGSENFLKKDSELSSDHRVQLTTDKELCWPVLLFYPHRGESDLIQEFYEGATFQEELEQVLQVERPSWDTTDEFVLDNVDVYFTDMETGGYVKVNLLDKLKDVLKHKRYVLPPNGVPAFMIMARGNPVCEMYLERMKNS